MHAAIALPIEPFKDAMRIALEAIKLQIAILESNGYSSQRGQFIQAMRAQVLFLQNLVRKTDEAFCEVVQDCCEQLVHENAETRDELMNLAVKTSDPDIEKFAGAISNVHTQIVNDLGKNETKIVRAISQEFAELYREIDNLLTAINNLRVR